MKPSILVVDDDKGTREYLQNALTEDFNIVEAGEGYDGLSEVMVGEHHIDLIITDLNMPGLNGIELIRNLPKGIPVIVISGYLKAPEFEKALAQLQPVAVLEKPFDISTLRRTVDRALDR